MSEEIKEIIRLDCEEYLDVKYFAKDGCLVDTTMDYSQLLDYIETLQQKLEQLENIRKEAIKYILKNKLYRFKYDDEELFEITTDKKTKDDLLNILNKGSD